MILCSAPVFHITGPPENPSLLTPSRRMILAPSVVMADLVKCFINGIQCVLPPSKVAFHSPFTTAGYPRNAQSPPNMRVESEIGVTVPALAIRGFDAARTTILSYL